MEGGGEKDSRSRINAHVQKGCRSAGRSSISTPPSLFYSGALVDEGLTRGRGGRRGPEGAGAGGGGGRW